jgi:hypothetical protein
LNPRPPAPKAGALPLRHSPLPKMASDLRFCPSGGSVRPEHTAVTLPNSVGFQEAQSAQIGGHERKRKRHQGAPTRLRALAAGGPSLAANDRHPNRFRALQQFFKFAVEEEEIDRSPMERMQRPTVPLEPVPVLSTEDLRALLAACAGKAFEDKRDTASVRLFVDTGMRRGELLGLTVTDIDFDQDVALVLGKGRKARACPFGSKTGLAIGRYLRLRSAHNSRGKPRCGSAREARSPRPASPRCCGAGPNRPGSARSTPTSSATPSPTPGCPREATRATSYA